MFQENVYLAGGVMANEVDESMVMMWMRALALMFLSLTAGCSIEGKVNEGGLTAMIEEMNALGNPSTEERQKWSSHNFRIPIKIDDNSYGISAGYITGCSPFSGKGWNGRMRPGAEPGIVCRLLLEVPDNVPKVMDLWIGCAGAKGGAKSKLHKHVAVDTTKKFMGGDVLTRVEGKNTVRLRVDLPMCTFSNGKKYFGDWSLDPVTLMPECRTLALSTRVPWIEERRGAAKKVTAITEKLLSSLKPKDAAAAMQTKVDRIRSLYAKYQKYEGSKIVHWAEYKALAELAGLTEAQARKAVPQKALDEKIIRSLYKQLGSFGAAQKATSYRVYSSIRHLFREGDWLKYTNYEAVHRSHPNRSDGAIGRFPLQHLGLSLGGPVTDDMVRAPEKDDRSQVGYSLKGEKKRSIHGFADLSSLPRRYADDVRRATKECNYYENKPSARIRDVTIGVVDDHVYSVRLDFQNKTNTCHCLELILESALGPRTIYSPGFLGRNTSTGGASFEDQYIKATWTKFSSRCHVIFVHKEFDR